MQLVLRRTREHGTFGKKLYAVVVLTSKEGESATVQRFSDVEPDTDPNSVANAEYRSSELLPQEEVPVGDIVLQSLRIDETNGCLLDPASQEQVKIYITTDKFL